MGNFIDKTFTVIADILLKVLPASKQEKEAFSYYRAGMSAQSKGRYAEALQNYYEALQVEEDPSLLYQIKYTIGYLKEFVSLSRWLSPRFSIYFSPQR